MPPTHELPISICLTGEEEANAQGDDHEEIAREAVAVEKGPAEEFEHSIEGFEDAHEENGNNQVIRYPISVIRKLPVEEKNEKAREGQPLEEADFGGKREEGEGKPRLRIEV
jgi:hypothetical protein